MNKKPRKRTNSNVPAKGRLRDFADKLWAQAVKADWAGRCAVCGSPKTESHHLVPRQHEGTRYDLNNGIALCCTHHQFDRDVSPHLNAAGWLAWLNHHWPARAVWYMDNRRPPFDGRRTLPITSQSFAGCSSTWSRMEFETICGVRFAAWLEETQVDDGGEA